MDHNSGKENENYKNDPTFLSTFSALPACNIPFWICEYLKFIFQFHYFGPFWSVKYLNFCQKLQIWKAHNALPERKYPQVTKNLYYVLFTR